MRLHESGALRIQAASYFGQMNHNVAVNDDELTIAASFTVSRDDIATLVINPQDVPPDAPEQRVDVQFKSPTDYWIYCVTSSVGPPLFVDFNADSCVIIRDRGRFTQMLREATRELLNGVVMHEGRALYVDPLFPPKGTIFVRLVSISNIRTKRSTDFVGCHQHLSGRSRMWMWRLAV